jgi:hypothetical protein
MVKRMVCWLECVRGCSELGCLPCNRRRAALISFIAAVLIVGARSRVLPVRDPRMHWTICVAHIIAPLCSRSTAYIECLPSCGNVITHTNNYRTISSTRHVLTGSWQMV